MVKKIAWAAQAKADLRAIDQRTAISILHGLARFAHSGKGDVERLQDVDPPELRLRVGDYRIRFRDHRDVIEILRIRHRSEAYR
jgi:mRNA-degrading endonuclease RelE of RelBE toxin-antitoxin system